MFLNIKLPNLNWTNETVPIKQGGSIIIALFGGWGIAFALGGLYFLVGDRIGAVPYLAIWAAVFTVLIALICSWLNTRGSRAFMELQ